jgi:uncharacterized protein YkwD
VTTGGGVLALAAAMVATSTACTGPSLGLDLRPGAGGGHRAHLSGWVEGDDDGHGTFRVTVDGRDVQRGTADATRTPWRLFGARAQHHVDASLPLPPGPHEVCVHLGDEATGEAGHGRLCRSVTVPAPDPGATPPGQGPGAPTATAHPAPPPTAAPAAPAPVAASALPATPALPAPAPAAWPAQMLAAVNAERARQNLAPLAACPRLDRAAQGYAEVMASTRHFDHTGLDGSTLTSRARDAGYLPAGGGWSVAENIAQGYPDVAAVMTGWMNSPGHRANILSPGLAHLGVGRAGGDYWVQDFGAGGNC